MDQLKKKERVFKEIGMLRKEPDPCTGELAKGSCLSGRSSSLCLFYIFCILSLSSLLLFLLPSLSSLLSSPPLLSPCCHLWKKMASLQFMCFPVTLGLHVRVPATTENHIAPSQLQISSTENLGTHSTLTRSRF